MSQNCRSGIRLPKVLHPGQPVGLGLILAIPGGIMTVLMVMALSSEDHWLVTVGTVFLILGFLYMFILGMYYLLMPLECLWISPEEIRLQLGPWVLRRISASEIRSIVSQVRTVLVKNRDADLYRLIIYPRGKWPRDRELWLDWSTEAEEAIKKTFPQGINLLF